MVRFRIESHPPEPSPSTGAFRRARDRMRRLQADNVRLKRELEELQGLARAAHLDPLTRLPNRRFFEGRLAEELSRASRDATYVGAVLVVDVNELKAVNDELGHAAGDKILTEIGTALRNALRAPDVCARTGGDEFMILLPDTDAAGARTVMARLRSAVIRAGSRRHIPASISVGAATWPADGRVASVLVDRADRRMYSEKRRAASRARRPESESRAGASRRTLTLVR